MVGATSLLVACGGSFLAGVLAARLWQVLVVPRMSARTLPPVAKTTEVTLLTEFGTSTAGLELDTHALLSMGGQPTLGEPRHDFLVGLLHQDQFVDQLRREINEHVRGERPLTLMLVKIEQLDTLLAKHGANTAEAMLRTLLQMIRATTRTKLDRVARYDQATIAVILTHTPLTEAQMSAVRLRRALAGCRLRIDGADVVFTAKVGLAELTDGHLDTLLNDAEAAAGVEHATLQSA